jgi:hypothetical protein
VSDYPFRSAPRRPRRRRWLRVARAALALVVLGAVFVLGVALGGALNDGPRAGTTVTYIRTLEPLPQQPSGTR